MIRDEAGRVTKGHGVVVDITERKKAEEALRLVVNELNHRVKNTLATVQSIAFQTLRNASDLDSAWERLEARLVALASAHDLITEANWAGAELQTLVDRVLAPVARDRVTVTGSSLLAPPQVALNLSLGLHELLTNALKHGALSGAKGQVAIAWTLEEVSDRRLLRLDWTETDGPPVKTPRTKGFGSRLLQRVFGSELGGKARLDFPESGVTCAIEVPLPPG
jgi:two-component sensor histidine kinase